MYDKHSQTTMTLWLAMAMTAAVATSAPDLWALDISKVMQGEWWRLASGHFVHLNWQHCLYDLLALGLAICLFNRLEKHLGPVIITTLCSACSVSLVLLIVNPVDIYGGISGITSGLLSFAVLHLITSDKRNCGIVLLVGMLLKIFLERQGISSSDVTPVWQAHCAGAAAGLFVFTFSLILNRREHEPIISAGEKTIRSLRIKIFRTKKYSLFRCWKRQRNDFKKVEVTTWTP